MIYVLRFFKFLISLLLAALVAGLGVATTYAVKWGRELPDYRELDNLTRSLGAETRVYARDNTPLGTLIPKVGDQAISRTIVSLDEISPFMVAALISNEDRRFFEHYGLDPYGIGRQFQRLARGENVQGGSTLTNQLIKNTLLLEEYQQARSPDRKFKEWMLSVQVERSFTKEEILQNYLNAIYWGDGGPVELYGIYSAAQAYFGTTPKQLTLGQSAYLTVLVPSPGRFYPNYKAVRPLMKTLLARMVEDGWITQAQMDAAWREKVEPRGWKITYDAQGNVLSANNVDPTQKELKAVTSTRAPHFMGQVETELVRRFGREKVYGSGGLRVYTTMDPKIQNAVETASREATGLPPGTTLGATIINPYTGEVLGMIGQKLRGSEPPAAWNNAAQGQRQIGSTIKPLLYTTALSTGLTQAHREEDRPISFPCTGCKNGVYAPQNFEGNTTYRDMTIREALDRSLNLVTVRLADRIGLQTFFGKLRQLGLQTNDGTGLAAALGAVETTPVKMAAAYAPFVNGGLYRAPRYLTRVTTARGEVLYDAGSEPVRPARVWTPQIAWLGLDMIRGVVNDMTEAQGGLATRAKFGDWPVAGKTGTSNGPKDFWFVGTTPLYTGAAWVGRQQGGDMPTYYYSGYVAAPIWRRMMELAHAGQATRQFSEPPGIQYAPAPDPQFLPNVKIAVLDPSFRGAANTDVQEDAPPPVQYRETGYAPTEDPNTVLVSLDRVTNRLATEFTPPENIVQRRVEIEALPAYAPDPAPQPLKDETPDPAALKATRTPANQAVSGGQPGP
ncbi:transglycosylase domain-containing protein [Deinococcus multiflagellatus]|uniref:transglycosylase domain-containing protein n=1 Tax=Deinococcus multiflagellatus TaxID=1656887 RepID=UPI001CCF7D83|nr:transglycosylase domain-containing protein [Deinococcus multiflagellatus]MBZ9712785.1 penicillin-binding protein [Deinococcus multiflagellatus]